MKEIAEIEAMREELMELLRGGFAPVVVLLREFHYDKVAIQLDGLPYSTWSLLEHMRERQSMLLDFMKNPDEVENLWPQPWWPEKSDPGSPEVWEQSIARFEQDLDEIIRMVEDPDVPLFEPRLMGKTLFWAATTNLEHNAYHIGQIKAIGRQLGVW